MKTNMNNNLFRKITFEEKGKKPTSTVHKNESIYHEETSFCTQVSFVVTKDILSSDIAATLK